MNEGWSCPKCNTVWAPFVIKCTDCGGATPGHCPHIWGAQTAHGAFCILCGMQQITWQLETKGNTGGDNGNS